MGSLRNRTNRQVKPSELEEISEALNQTGAAHRLLENDYRNGQIEHDDYMTLFQSVIITQNAVLQKMRNR